MSTNRDRLMELLTDRALTGLGQREQIELAELLVQAQDVDVATFDKAASAIALASVAPLSKMPASLASKLEDTLTSAMGGHAPHVASGAGAPSFAQTTVDEVLEASPSELHEGPRGVKHTMTMDDRPAAAATRPSWNAPQAQPFVAAQPPMRSYPAPSISHVPQVASHLPQPYPQATSNVVPLRAARAPSRAIAIGGWVAAAACLLLAIGAFATRKPTTPLAIATTPSAIASPPPVTSAAAKITPAELREKLLASASTTRASWETTKDPLSKGASGDVVWNKEQQKGVMRFQGLAKNDPSRAQYQLWIFDKDRDAKYPVDGGVFDVDAETGDVLVAIHAALPVDAPVLFAVTLERPGGVVVSKRDRLVVTAKPVAG